MATQPIPSDNTTANDSVDAFLSYMSEQDPAELQKDRAEAWRPRTSDRWPDCT